ncbi:MAG: hypothetical protein HOP12_13735 [Candidatus Eisenbacteria bacterium]|uniref:Glycosyltransferase RgtA/B/C/D-like domain-containing protein n=1 Tax=Eiseniibacteriota bacterium TaxID=2212470 RepID=A0A849SN30_UNCEI|nr:hypothetical protein [Candidatus Eisenbacteria bacterium]
MPRPDGIAAVGSRRDSTSNRRLAFGLLVAVAAAVLFTGLGSVALLDDREARNAAVANELLARGEFVTPTLGGTALLERPVAAYVPDLVWNAFRARSPVPGRAVRALLAVALAALTGLIGARLFGARAGLCAAGVLLTTLGLPFTARLDGGVLLAALAAWSACGALAELVVRRNPSPTRWIVLAWVSLALAALTGGPTSAAWPLLGLGLYLRLARRSERWRALRPLAGVAIVAGLCLPWYGAMFERHGVAFLRALPAFPHGGGPAPETWLAALATPVSAVTLLMAAAFPWSAMLPAAVLHASTWWGRSRRAPERAREVAGDGGAVVLAELERQLESESTAHLVIAWLFAALVPCMLVFRAPLTAVLPALPAIALLTGRLLDHVLEAPHRVRLPLENATRMLAFVGVPVAFLATLAANRLLEAQRDLRLLAALIVVLACAPALAALIGRLRTAALLFALPVLLAAPLINARVLHALEPYASTRPVGDALVREAPAGAALVLLESAPPSLRLYAPRAFVVAGHGTAKAPGPPLARALRESRARDGRTYVAFRPQRESEVRAATVSPLEILIRTPSLVLARVNAE